MRRRRKCKQCGADVGSPDFSVCGSCACLPRPPVAEDKPARLVADDGMAGLQDAIEAGDTALVSILAEQEASWPTVSQALGPPLSPEEHARLRQSLLRKMAEKVLSIPVPAGYTDRQKARIERYRAQLMHQLANERVT